MRVYGVITVKFKLERGVQDIFIITSPGLAYNNLVKSWKLNRMRAGNEGGWISRVLTVFFFLFAFFMSHIGTNAAWQIFAAFTRNVCQCQKWNVQGGGWYSFRVAAGFVTGSVVSPLF